jgi:hypothetical protein
MDNRELQRGLVAFMKNAIDDVKETFFGAQIAVECPRCGHLVDRKHLDTPCGEHPPLEEEDPYQQQVNVRFERAETPEAKPEPKKQKVITQVEKDRIIDETMKRISQGDDKPSDRLDGGYQRKPDDRARLDEFTIRLNNHLAKIAYENPTSQWDLDDEIPDQPPTYRMRDE